MGVWFPRRTPGIRPTDRGGGRVYVGSDNGFVYAIDAESAAVWSASTIDPERRRIYLSTSNGYTYPAINSTDAVMALDLDSGKRLWTRQLTPNDAYVIGGGPIPWNSQVAAR